MKFNVNATKVLCLLLFSVMAFTCDGQYHANGRHRQYDVEESYPKNDCKTFLLDTAGKANIRFKKVTISLCELTADTNYKARPVRRKQVCMYNKRGEMLFYFEYDTLGKNIIDSDRETFDAAYRKISAIGYHRNDSLKMELVNYRKVVYNLDGRKKMDSSFYIKRDWTTLPNHKLMPDFDTTRDIRYLDYDKQGNITLFKYISSDTSVFKYTYDKENRELSATNLGREGSRNTYFKYDSHGNKTEELEVDFVDTTREDYTYDSLNRVVYYSKHLTFPNSRQPNKVTRYLYNRNNSYSKVEESSAPAGDQFSCSNDSHVESSYDKSGRLLSETTVRMENGEQETDMEIHKYTFNKKDSILTDTDVSTSQSKWEYTKYLNAAAYAYDEKGNKVLNVCGGREYTYLNNNDSKVIWQYNNKNKLTYEAHFNSCSDSPYFTIRYFYNTDGITLNKTIQTGKIYEEYGEYSKDIKYYGKDTRILEEVGYTDNGVDHWVWQYEE